jgi:ATP-dependent Clp protease ATP-binding subunit ClpC
MQNTLNLSSIRAKKARLGHRIGRVGLVILGVSAFVLIGLFIYLLSKHENHIIYLLLAGGLLCSVIAIWYEEDLAVLTPQDSTLTGSVDHQVLYRLKPGVIISPKSLWKAVEPSWQTSYILVHLLLTNQAVEDRLSSNEPDMVPVWEKATEFADKFNSKTIEPAHIVGALLVTSPVIKELLNEIKLNPADVESVVDWLSRNLAMLNIEKPYFGGIGRDWAHGFTPILSHYGQNVSLSVERGGGYYGWLTNSPGVNSIRGAFSQGAPAVALVGPTGIGKSSHVYALAQKLLQEANDPKLEHRQIISLNPSLIISAAQNPGDLEQIILALTNEAIMAGNIVLFFDEAQLFFSSGPGSFDITQILLPVLESGRTQIIMAMTPNDYQNLKANRSALAAKLSPVVLTELPEKQIINILEDTASNLEAQHKIFITYQAIREAYRLSGRYDQDTAYPGKAINLLTQSLQFAENNILSDISVQKSVEQGTGVKVGAAKPVEAQALLNLEDKIHERMINQKRAVSVVANALRRARTGVADPKRPLGSFLFLGPTGVGKTELAKAIAATYFGDENNMIRLDMSEYQQPSDINRLLDHGSPNNKTLTMAVREQPFSVVLLDEIEKAHSNILDLFLQLIDEGKLTDSSDRAVSFKDCIIIATSNAGAEEIRDRVQKGQNLEGFEGQLTDDLIKAKSFKPEFLNRFDNIVLFGPLNEEELAQVVKLMTGGINQTLSQQNISIDLTPAAVKKIVSIGYDARLGARPMRRALQSAVEDGLAEKILRGSVKPGDHVLMDVKDLKI